MKYHFTVEEKLAIMMAIKSAELSTSCEIRVCIEKYSEEDSSERVKYIFEAYGMFKTKKRNAVLLYLSVGNKSFDIYADIGVRELVSSNFFDKTKSKMRSYFDKNNFTMGLIWGIENSGFILKSIFPFDENKDNNELSDEIIIEE